MQFEADEALNCNAINSMLVELLPDPNDDGKCEYALTTTNPAYYDDRFIQELFSSTDDCDVTQQQVFWQFETSGVDPVERRLYYIDRTTSCENICPKECCPDVGPQSLTGIIEGDDLLGAYEFTLYRDRCGDATFEGVCNVEWNCAGECSPGDIGTGQITVNVECNGCHTASGSRMPHSA